MAHFQIGDRAKIIRGQWKNHVGTITEVVEQDDERGIKPSCTIVIPEKPFGMEFDEYMLERIELTDSEKSLRFFESFLPKPEK